jgi:hypothetical protein
VQPGTEAARGNSAPVHRLATASAPTATASGTAPSPDQPQAHTLRPLPNAPASQCTTQGGEHEPSISQRPPTCPARAPGSGGARRWLLVRARRHRPAQPSPSLARLTVTSTLDGHTVLPHRIHWQAFASAPAGHISKVDYLIDGRLSWVETQRPTSTAATATGSSPRSSSPASTPSPCGHSPPTGARPPTR